MLNKDVEQMCNDVSNYEYASGLTKEQLELEIMLCIKNLLAAKSLEDHRIEHNKFQAYVFRLRELKGF